MRGELRKLARWGGDSGVSMGCCWGWLGRGREVIERLWTGSCCVVLGMLWIVVRGEKLWSCAVLIMD